MVPPTSAVKRGRQYKAGKVPRLAQATPPSVRTRRSEPRFGMQSFGTSWR